MTQHDAIQCLMLYLCNQAPTKIFDATFPDHVDPPPDREDPYRDEYLELIVAAARGWRFWGRLDGARRLSLVRAAADTYGAEVRKADVLYTCKNCGSQHVERLMPVDLNTLEVDPDGEETETTCRECSEVMRYGPAETDRKAVKL